MKTIPEPVCHIIDRHMPAVGAYHVAGVVVRSTIHAELPMFISPRDTPNSLRRHPVSARAHVYHASICATRSPATPAPLTLPLCVMQKSEFFFLQAAFSANDYARRGDILRQRNHARSRYAYASVRCAQTKRDADISMSIFHQAFATPSQRLY